MLKFVLFNGGRDDMWVHAHDASPGGDEERTGAEQNPGILDPVQYRGGGSPRLFHGFPDTPDAGRRLVETLFRLLDNRMRQRCPVRTEQIAPGLAVPRNDRFQIATGRRARGDGQC